LAEEAVVTNKLVRTPDFPDFCSDGCRDTLKWLLTLNVQGSGSMGSAAAMQALKMFTGGGSGNSASGNSQNAFVGMAMAQASKLFDSQSSQGNVASGASKESVVQQAGEMALKMYMQSQGGGASGLMGLASKFL